jgi:hypothetical protein
MIINKKSIYGLYMSDHFEEILSEFVSLVKDNIGTYINDIYFIQCPCDRFHNINGVIFNSISFKGHWGQYECKIERYETPKYKEICVITEGLTLTECISKAINELNKLLP